MRHREEQRPLGETDARLQPTFSDAASTELHATDWLFDRRGNIGQRDEVG